MTNASIVSVIVPTKNSSMTLEKCLKNIRTQTYEGIELIVVDNFSDDATFEIAKRYADFATQKGPERSTQRNYGVQKAHGEFVAIIDSDMYLEPGVIEECVLAMKNDIYGVIIPEESIGSGFWAHCKSFERSFYLGVPYMEAARFFRKDTFTSLDGYDEGLISGEDWDFSQRVSKLGKLSRIRTLIMHDEGHISLVKTIRKKYYYAQHFARYIKKNSASSEKSRQTSVLYRYGLYFKKPGKLLQHPILSIGMLFMKTCEFAAGGFGLIFAGKR